MLAPVPAHPFWVATLPEIFLRDGSIHARQSAGPPRCPPPATNHLGAFSLSGTLLPHFRKQVQARIVNVGSLAHRFAELDLDDLNREKTTYSEWKAHARSELLLLSFTMELDTRLRKSGSNVIALDAHPGFANTYPGRGSAARAPRSAFHRWFSDKLVEAQIPEAPVTARPIVHAASAPAVNGGDYYGPTSLLGTRGRTGRARVNPAARDVAARRRRWTLSEEMTRFSCLSSL